MGKKIKLAIIGTGKWGLERACGFKDLGTEIVAVADLNPSIAIEASIRLQLDTSCIYGGEDGWLDMLAKHGHKIDGIVVLTPPLARGEMVPYLLEQGYSLYLEKPICANREQLMKIMRIYQSSHYDKAGNGPITATGHAGRSPLFKFVKEKIKSQELGTIKAFHFSYGWKWNYFNDSNWRGQPDMGGGHILEKLIHQLEAIYNTFGPIGYVSASGHRLKKKWDEWDQITASLKPYLHLLSDIAINLSASFGISNSDMQSMEVVFEKQRYIGYKAGKRFIVVDENGNQQDIGGDCYWWPINNMKSFLNVLSNSINEEVIEYSELRSTLYDGMQAMDIALGLKDSITECNKVGLFSSAIETIGIGLESMYYEIEN